MQCKGGSDDIEIRWNRLVDAGARGVNMGGSTGFQYFRPPLSKNGISFEARDIRVIANVIEGSQASLAFVGCLDCVAAHNTLIEPGKWLLRILQETKSQQGYTFAPASNGLWVNNLAWFQRAKVKVDVNIGPDTEANTFVFSNNLWYAHDKPSASKPKLPSAESGGVAGDNPAFINGKTGYEIGANSPAAGTGKVHGDWMIKGGLHGDFAGQCYDTPPSIGALAAGS